MRRFEALKEINSLLENEIVVSNIGHPSRELFSIQDRPENFYMLGSLGLASSIGLGLALSSQKQVIAIDGDGGILMNLGSLITCGTRNPGNFTLVIIDNHSYGSTGFQPTFTSGNIDLSKFAEVSHFESVHKVSNRSEIKPVLEEGLTSCEGSTALFINVKPGKPADLPIIDLEPTDIRDRIRERIDSQIDY